MNTILSDKITLYNIPNPRNNLNGVSTTGFEKWYGSNKDELVVLAY